MAVIRRSRGFTLIELAISMAVVALLLGGLSVPLSKRITEQQYADTQARIDKAAEALVGFAMLNQRLPCPDISTTVADNRDGFEDYDTLAGNCKDGAATAKINYTNSTDIGGVSWGDLPWKTLGIDPPNQADAWDNRLRYAVYEPLAGNANGALSFLTAANMLNIRCTNPATPTYAANVPNCIGPSYTIINNAAFIVYSMGANGIGTSNINTVGAYNSFGANQTLTNTPIPDQFANAPENESTVALRREFVVRDRTDRTSSASEFDDLAGYMSSVKLAARLLNAGAWQPN